MKKHQSLIIILLMFLAFAVSADARNEEKIVFDDFSVWDFYVPPMPKTIQPQERKTIILHDEFFDTMRHSSVTVTIMKTESLGWYFITAYCPAECGGSWATASGATCHRADWEDRYTEPTTCAISRSIHSFGDMFYIEEFDRIFIAEDTGSGVRGKHLDLFYEDYDDVLSFPTGYYEVFSVEYEEVEVYLGEHQ